MNQIDMVKERIANLPHEPGGTFMGVNLLDLSKEELTIIAAHLSQRRCQTFVRAEPEKPPVRNPIIKFLTHPDIAPSAALFTMFLLFIIPLVIILWMKS